MGKKITVLKILSPFLSFSMLPKQERKIKLKEKTNMSFLEALKCKIIPLPSVPSKLDAVDSFFMSTDSVSN